MKDGPKDHCSEAESNDEEVSKVIRRKLRRPDLKSFDISKDDKYVFRIDKEVLRQNHF